MLAEALGVPLVRPGDVWPRIDGGIEVQVGPERVPVDVLYRRFDDSALGAYRIPMGQALDAVLADAVAGGTSVNRAIGSARLTHSPAVSSSNL